jgi:RHS repeat-associated protein
MVAAVNSRWNNSATTYTISLLDVPTTGIVGVTLYNPSLGNAVFGTALTNAVFDPDFRTASNVVQQYKCTGEITCDCQGSLQQIDRNGNRKEVAGEPIRLANGNLFETALDYQTAGPNQLAFSRFYNSLADPNSRAVSLGRNWRSIYDRYLTISDEGILAERTDGQELIFNSNGTNWISDADVDIQITQSNSDWILTNLDDSVETYNSAGFLVSIQARDGYLQTLQYDGNNHLLSVTDSFGRALQFTYQSNLLQTVTAPNGLILTYAYTSSGQTPGALDRLASVSYSTSPQTSQSYLYENSSFPFALTGLIDENGARFASWTYDSSGRANSSQHAGGTALTLIGYNPDGSVSVTNSLGQVLVYKFTPILGVPKVSEIDRLASATVPAAAMTYSYDTNGYIAAISDWNTTLTGLTNDVHGQPLVLSEAVGSSAARVTTNTFHPIFHLPIQIVATNVTASFLYDALGNPLTVTETDTSTNSLPYATTGQTRVWSNTFDNFGHVLTATGPRTDVVATTVYAYDTNNNLSTVTDPLGHTTLFTNYTGSGIALTMIDPNGVVTAFGYDVRDRLLSRTVQAASGNATTTFGYDAAGNVTRIMLPDGSFLDCQYDAAHRMYAVSNALGETITYLRDPNGDVTNQTIRGNGGALAKVQNQVFDSLGRMLQQIGASGQTTTFGYDNDDSQVSITDGLTNTTLRAFDALNRLITSVDPLTNSTHYGLDSQDNVVSVTDPRILTTSYIRDGFGRVIEQNSPDTGTTIYLLDNAGNRTNETDARGVVTTRTFDKVNRVTSETFPASPGENISYTYDATNGGNFGIGRLTGYADETGSTTLTYNERGDVVSTTRTIGGTAYTTAYGYDLADHVTSITYPSGHYITFSRDSQGRISGAVFQNSMGGGATVLASGVTYAPFGPLTGLRYGNHLIRTQVYDLDYRLAAITTGSNVQNLILAYDSANDIKSITDQIVAARSQTFSYDPDNRLTQATGIYGPVGYSYDPDGNRLSRTAGGITATFNYSPTANALQSVTSPGVNRAFSYTASGNEASDSGTATNLQFGYGNRNRYRTLTFGGTTASYQYNALGQRLIKTVNGVTTQFHYDEKGHLIAESQPGGILIREYVWLDDMPLAQIEANGTMYFIHPDHLNAPQKMTDQSTAGNVVLDFEHQPFGEAVPPTMTGIGFDAGKQFQLTLTGPPNSNYIIQATANLAAPSWTPLTTNAASFMFTDAAEGGLSARFYRAQYLSGSGGITNNLRFPGQYFDAESGFSYNTMRDYDPSLGRYIQADPIGMSGGINLFSYATADPVEIADLSGLRSIVNSGIGGGTIAIIPDSSSVPAVTIPMVAGAQGVSASDMFFHKYAVDTSSVACDLDPIGRALANHPTPGLNNKTATSTGVLNDAGAIFWQSENYVMSFVLPSQNPNMTPIIVNYTTAQHELAEGFVIRWGTVDANGQITLHTYGEGNSYEQAPALEGIWGDKVQQVWQNNQKDIFIQSIGH